MEAVFTQIFLFGRVAQQLLLLGAVLSVVAVHRYTRDFAEKTVETKMIVLRNCPRDCHTDENAKLSNEIV